MVATAAAAATAVPVAAAVVDMAEAMATLAGTTTRDMDTIMAPTAITQLVALTMGTNHISFYSGRPICSISYFSILSHEQVC